MNKNRIPRWLAISSAAALLVSVGTLQTQAGPRGPRAPGGAMHPAITLTAAQQQALKDAHAAILTQSETLFTQQAAARKGLQDAVLADNPSEDAIRAAAKTIGDIEGSLAIIRAKELAKVRSLFTIDRWTKLKATGLFDHELFGPHKGGHPQPPATN